MSLWVTRDYSITTIVLIPTVPLKMAVSHQFMFKIYGELWYSAVS